MDSTIYFFSGAEMWRKVIPEPSVISTKCEVVSFSAGACELLQGSRIKAANRERKEIAITLKAFSPAHGTGWISVCFPSHELSRILFVLLRFVPLGDMLEQAGSGCRTLASRAASLFPDAGSLP